MSCCSNAWLWRGCCGPVGSAYVSERAADSHAQSVVRVCVMCVCVMCVFVCLPICAYPRRRSARTGRDDDVATTTHDRLRVFRFLSFMCTPAPRRQQAEFLHPFPISYDKLDRLCRERGVQVMVVVKDSIHREAPMLRVRCPCSVIL